MASPAAATVVDLAAHRAARGLCAICRRWVPRAALWVDAEARVWDVCTACADAAHDYCAAGIRAGR